MERLTGWLTRVPARLAPRMAWLYLVGAAFYFWRVLFRDSVDLGVGRLITGALFGIFLLSLSLGSLLPEERGGFALRGATRWLAIPMGIGFVLFLVEIYQGSGAQTLVGLAIFLSAVIALSWFVRRWRHS